MSDRENEIKELKLVFDRAKNFPRDDDGRLSDRELHSKVSGQKFHIDIISFIEAFNSIHVLQFLSAH